MAFGIGASAVGLLLLVVGTRFRQSVVGSVTMIVGSAVLAVGLLFLGMEGLTLGEDA
jgi:hypothetical protein